MLLHVLSLCYIIALPNLVFNLELRKNLNKKITFPIQNTKIKKKELKRKYYIS